MNPINKHIPLYKFEHEKLVLLNRNEIEILKGLYKVLNKKKFGEKIYRGEKYVELLNIQTGSNIKKYSEIREYQHSYFSSQLFIIGEKSKHFLKEKKEEIKKRSYLKNINDCSSKTFEYIFNKINEIHTKPIKDLNIDITYINNYIKREKKFYDFFRDRNNNIQKFKNISKINFSNKLAIRDYYLYYLHTLGKDGISENSFLKSTSFDYKKSKKFSNGIILYGWVKKPTSSYGISSRSFLKCIEKCKRLDLPIYTKDIFPHEKEISLKGGFFPHYIIGYENTIENYFVINNHIVNESKEIVKEFPDLIIKYGLPIDQSEFDQKVKKTKYRKYFIRTPEGKYIEKYCIE